mmetsp:Transcript_56921/g.101897  ORF Transcript_56921/g.101897 Transcript_56921/m.101897 type:complete len:177 (+) Transcript_56921:103-633(+)
MFANERSGKKTNADVPQGLRAMPKSEPETDEFGFATSFSRQTSAPMGRDDEADPFETSEDPFKRQVSAPATCRSPVAQDGNKQKPNPMSSRPEEEWKDADPFVRQVSSKSGGSEKQKQADSFSRQVSGADPFKRQVSGSQVTDPFLRQVSNASNRMGADPFLSKAAADPFLRQASR